MKKTFKKLFAALLAAALVLAMAVPAFAETNAPKGSITISKTVKDETYTIYRMFKLDSYNAESNTYSYTVESDWEGFFKTGAGGNYITLDGQNHPTWTAADENDSTTVAAFAKAALAWAADKKISGTKETATGDTVTFSNLDLGYYLVDSSLGALCGLNTTNPNATLNKDAVIDGDGNTNEVKLGYGNHQNTVPSKVTTKSYQFDLVKVDGTANEDGTHTLLNGAKFKLYETKTSDTALRFVKNADGSYRVALDTENGENVTDTIVVNGKVHISGLDKVNYWLDETLAPDGYNKLTERQEVKLSEGSQNATLETGATTWAEGNGGVVVENNAGTVLPSTGGMGTTLFYVIGGGLMVAAVVLLVTKKRMEHKN